MAASGVHVEHHGPVLEVTIDRPEANAIDAPTSRRLGEVFSAFRDDPRLRVAIVTGAGTRFFSTGFDLKALRDAGAPDRDVGVGGFGGLELPGLDKPVISAVNGMAVGGGFEIAIAADLVIAAEHARFALREIKVGVFPDAAAIKLPRQIPHHVALDLLLTGRWMSADEAHRWGLVREVVPAERLMPAARELAALLADGPPLATAAIKQIVRETAHLPIADAFAIVESERLPAVAATMSSGDALEGARAFTEKRAPRWTEP